VKPTATVYVKLVIDYLLRIINNCGKEPVEIVPGQRQPAENMAGFGLPRPLNGSGLAMTRRCILCHCGESVIHKGCRTTKQSHVFQHVHKERKDDDYFILGDEI
jgi:hypothetical protein